MEKTATQIASEKHLYLNLRRRRAEALVANTMRVLDGIIPDGRKRDAYYALLDSYIGAGVEVLTDQERADAGLQPRGELGWTPQELHALEAKRLEALMRPVAMFLPTPPTADKPSKGQ